MKTKEEKLEYNKQYRIVNKEKIRLSRIKYDLKNKEKIKEQHKVYGKQYRIKNVDKLKQYYINNKEKIKQCPSNSPEKRKIIDTKYRNKNPDKIKDYKLRKNYGIGLDDYNTIFNQQEGKCKICNTHQDKLIKKLVVDHDHCTGNIRGLLCDKCNRGLGHFNDNIELLQKAVNYLVT